METKDYLLLGLVLLGVIGFVGYKIVTQNSGENKNPQPNEQEATVNSLIKESTSTTQEEEGQFNMPNKNPKQYSKAPSMALEAGKDYKAVLHTSKGDITVDLFETEAPVTVNNFVFLANEGFYNGTIFHRIIKDFMIQGGDPLGNGTGGPGYRFADEPITRDYEAGILAMANSGPNTNGSQFFIMHKETPLPKNYVIFGKVEDSGSMNIVDSIANTPVRPNQFGENSTPTETVTISSVDIITELN